MDTLDNNDQYDLNDQYDAIYKLILCGNSGVGKSNISHRFTRNEFIPELKTTIGVEFATRSIKVNGKIIKVQIWDTAGQERYRAITSCFYRGSCGSVIVYDVNNKGSFDCVDRWYDELKEYSPDDVVVMLIGNKTDLGDDNRQVSTEQGVEYAKAHGLSFMETSALDSTNINEAFGQLISEIYCLKNSNSNRLGPVTNTISIAHPNCIQIDTNQNHTEKSMFRQRPKCCH